MLLTSIHKFAFYACDYIYVLLKSLFVPFLKDPTYKQYHVIILSLSDLTSVSMSVSIYIRITANGIILFPFMALSLLYICITSLSILLSVDI